jgi:hypothetical protein
MHRPGPRNALAKGGVFGYTCRCFSVSFPDPGSKEKVDMKVRSKNRSKTRRKKAALRRKQIKARLRMSRGHQKF